MLPRLIPVFLRLNYVLVRVPEIGNKKAELLKKKKYEKIFRVPVWPYQSLNFFFSHRDHTVINFPMCPYAFILLSEIGKHHR